MRAKWEINMAITGLKGIATVAECITSPQRAIVRIVKSQTNAALSWPVAWLDLECGHTAGAVLADRNGNAHDDGNHLARVGMMHGCPRCAHYAQQLERLRAMPAGSMQHSRFRHHDSRGFGAGAHYLYRRDPKSPSGVILELTIDDKPEAVAELRRVTGTSSLSPTEGH